MPKPLFCKGIPYNGGIFMWTRHVFVKHGCPRWQQNPKYGKISKSQILTPPNPQGHGMSVKCEKPLDEPTVQVWLLYDNANFKYCTLFISGTELWTDGRTDRRTDDPNTRCPWRTFQAGGIKTSDPRNAFGASKSKAWQTKVWEIDIQITLLCWRHNDHLQYWLAFFSRFCIYEG